MIAYIKYFTWTYKSTFWGAPYQFGPETGGFTLYMLLDNIVVRTIAQSESSLAKSFSGWQICLASRIYKVNVFVLVRIQRSTIYNKNANLVKHNSSLFISHVQYVSFISIVKNNS